MRTHTDIDDELLQQAFSISNLRTKKALIQEALKAFIQLKKREDLNELADVIEFEKDYDYKKSRETRE
jgi:Arc/MetJ family transcription regulator